MSIAVYTATNPRPETRPRRALLWLGRIFQRLGDWLVRRALR